MAPIVRASGTVIFACSQPLSFLLMKHKHRWDLPKGHAEPGESLLETALRETEEETGISKQLLRIDPNFQFDISYDVDYKRGGKHHKQVSYFLAFIPERLDIRLTEHEGFEWMPWPTGAIQKATIDPLMDSIAKYVKEKQLPEFGQGLP